MESTKTTTTRTREAEPSADALRAFEQFDALARFYRSQAQFARALDWQPNTVAAWHHRSVLRPRVEHRRAVDRLLRVASEAAEWVPEDHLVGDWTLQEQSELKGCSPCQVLSILEDRGVTWLLAAFNKIAPQTMVGVVELPSAGELEAALRENLGGETLAMFERAGSPRSTDVDLSDFDD